MRLILGSPAVNFRDSYYPEVLILELGYPYDLRFSTPYYTGTRFDTIPILGSQENCRMSRRLLRLLRIFLGASEWAHAKNRKTSRNSSSLA